MVNKKIGKKQRVLRVMLIFLGALLVTGFFFRQTIMHVYHGITLFHPSRMSENFRNLDERFPSKKVGTGDTVFLLEDVPRDLPEDYEYMGESRSVGAFIEQTATTGLLVARGDQIVYEEYFQGYTEKDRMMIWSVSKSVVSALMGIAVEEGHIGDVNDLVTAYVPSLEASGYREATIRDVLQMSSGVGFSEDYGDGDADIARLGSRSFGFGGAMEEVILSLESVDVPGTINRYVSSDTQVLGMVLMAATGTDLTTLTEEKLWKPAGMQSHAAWLTDSTGVEAAFGGFNATLRDLARFGLLYLNEGTLKGRQIIPGHWIAESMRTDEAHLVPGDNSLSDWVLGYGYQWWIPEGTEGEFLALGIYGQAIYVNPMQNVVIVKTSAYPDYEVDGEEMELESIAFFRRLARDLGTEDVR